MGAVASRRVQRAGKIAGVTIVAFAWIYKAIDAWSNVEFVWMKRSGIVTFLLSDLGLLLVTIAGLFVIWLSFRPRNGTVTPNAVQRDEYLRGRIEELEREGGRIIQALHQIQDSQATDVLVREVGAWATQTNRAINHRCPVDAAMILAGFPPEDDRYEKDLLIGFMNAAMGYLDRCKSRPG